MLAFMGLPGGQEWIIILIVAVLLFGARLPSVFRSLGKSVTEFKKGLREVEDEVGEAGELAEGNDSGDESSYPVG